MKAFNYNYPKSLRAAWQDYQAEYYCLVESHAVVNLIVLGLKNSNVPTLVFDNSHTERFSMQLSDELLKEIDKTKKTLGATTRIQAIHILIGKGLYVAKNANELLTKAEKNERLKRKDGSEPLCSSIVKRTIS